MAPRRAPKYSMATNSGRFGDEEPRAPPRIKPKWGGKAPPYIETGFPHFAASSSLDTIGLAATPVAKWGNDMDHASVSRRPAEYDYLHSLAPGRYLGLHHPYDRKGACWTMVGSSLPPAPTAMTDSLGPSLHSLGKQPLSHSRTEPSLTFGTAAESRMRLIPFASKQEEQRNALARQKQRKGQTLDAADRECLRSAARGLYEEGAHTSSVQLPRSEFDEAGTRRTSSIFSFGASQRSSRFEPPKRATSSASLASKPPPFGGRSGSAFREQPLSTPGPGDYDVDRGFDGKGLQKLSHSHSVPCYSLRGKMPITKLFGQPDDTPGPTAYF